MELHIAANLFDAASDSILVHDTEGKFVYFNEVAFMSRGYTKDEFQTLRIHDLDAQGTNENFESKIQAIIGKGDTTFETLNIRKDRSVFPVEIHARAIESDNRKLVLSIARDITERKKAEEKLRESEAKYQTTFEASNDALMLLDEKGFLDCNKSTLEMFGLEKVEEFTTYHPADLSPPTQPDGSSSMDAATKHIAKAFETGKDNFNWIHKQKNGTTFFADVLLTRMPLKDRHILQATVRDITKQKEAERQLKENAQRIEVMNEKLRVVGGLTRHDIRNKLAALNGYAYLLKKKHTDEAEIINKLRSIEQSSNEIVKILDFAKMYEQLGVEELSYIDVERAMIEAVALFSGSTFKIVNDCKGLTVLADSFLRQLFYNFIDNTRKYGQKTTTIRVSCEKTETGELQLLYEDDGVGISTENKLKLFSEGFSTGNSTGFGLFLSKKMMDVYGWKIQEAGEPGKGAKFVMTIPAINPKGKENYRFTQL